MTPKPRNLSAGRFARWLGPVLAAATLFVCAGPLLAQNAKGIAGFDSFKFLRTRNIFDKDRRPATAQKNGLATPIAQSDYIALTGTLITRDKALAFFSGTRAEFNQVLPLQAKIAGATITKITGDKVTIDRAGKTATIPIGWTVPLNGSAPAPAPISGGAVPQPVAAFGAAGTENPVPAPNLAAAPPPPGGTIQPPAAPNDDVARMMRERRLQEAQ